MTSKQRVRAALMLEPVDRVPVFMWFHPHTARHLAAVLDVPPRCVPEAFGDDVCQTWIGNNHAMEGIVHEREGDGHTDRWGIQWRRHGLFNQIVGTPLVGRAPDEVRSYCFPEQHIEELLQLMEPMMRASGTRFIGCDISPCLLEMYCRLRGMESALADVAAEPGLVRDMLERCARFSVLLGEAACERYPVDWLWTGDDIGSQRGMMIGPGAWRDLVKPRLSRILRVAKERRRFSAFHSCGAIRPIVPDLVEIGVDVLNPVQCNCVGMDPVELKREFGRDLAFMGGVDTQRLLPNGTRDEVRSATERLLEAMTADGGGYILAASHTIPPETPDANVFALYAAAGISEDEIFDRAADIRRRAGCRAPTPLT